MSARHLPRARLDTDADFVELDGLARKSAVRVQSNPKARSIFPEFRTSKDCGEFRTWVMVRMNVHIPCSQCDTEKGDPDDPR